MEYKFSVDNHYKFFSDKKFDLDMYDKFIDPQNYNMHDYQEMLLYTFITHYIPKKARILQIGTRVSAITENLKHDYEFWILKNPDELISDNPEKISIKNYINERKTEENFGGYFDFIFYSSDIAGTKRSRSSQQTELRNLKYLTRTGGFFIHSFTYKINSVNELVNTVIQYIIKNSFALYKNLMIFFDINRIPTPSGNSLSINFFGQGNKIFVKASVSSGNEFVTFSFMHQKKGNEIPNTTKSKQIQYLSKSPAYVFHHIPKCGGTSVLNALNNWFSMEHDYVKNDDEVNAFRKYRYRMDKITSDTCLAGHFNYEGIFIHQRYPEIIERRNEIKAFTFVRDPLNFSISFYYYTRKFGRIDDVTLINHLRFNQNYLSSFIPCDESNYKEVFDRYFFVGITERMQESFDKLAAKLNKKRVIVTSENKSEKDEQFSEITPEFIEEFKEQNRLDYLIYNYCLEKFNNM